MNKFIFEPVSYNQAKIFLDDDRIYHIALGVNDCSNNIHEFSIKQINWLLKKSNKSISIICDRLFSVYEIDFLKQIFESIELNKVKYVFYTDLAIISILKELGFESKLCYVAHTYLTNSFDTKEYLTFNKNVVVSNQISLNELSNLLNNINKKVIIHGFGKAVIFYSKRRLLSNYFKFRHYLKNHRRHDYYLKEENRDELYNIYQNKFGTIILESSYYAIFEYDSLCNVDEIFIHSSDLNVSSYNEVVDLFIKGDVLQLKESFDIKNTIFNKNSVLLKERLANNE